MPQRRAALAVALVAALVAVADCGHAGHARRGDCPARSPNFSRLLSRSRSRPLPSKRSRRSRCCSLAVVLGAARASSCGRARGAARRLPPWRVLARLSEIRVAAAAMMFAAARASRRPEPDLGLRPPARRPAAACRGGDGGCGRGAGGAPPSGRRAARPRRAAVRPALRQRLPRLRLPQAQPRSRARLPSALRQRLQQRPRPAQPPQLQREPASASADRLRLRFDDDRRFLADGESARLPATARRMARDRRTG